jgi:hypothetical protein
MGSVSLLIQWQWGRGEESPIKTALLSPALSSLRREEREKTALNHFSNLTALDDDGNLPP